MTALVAVPAAERTYANTVLALEAAQMAVTDVRLAWADLAHVVDDDRLRETAWGWTERLEKRAIGASPWDWTPGDWNVRFQRK